MKNKIENIKLIIVTVLLIAIDQISKLIAIITLKGKPDINVIKDILLFKYLDGGNTGAAWGILSGQIWLFVLITIITSIVLLYLIIRTSIIINGGYSHNPKGIKLVRITLVFLFSGAVGNLIDRIFRGYVVDFIYFKPINFPIFNIADCYVTVACIALVFVCFFVISETDFNHIFTIGKHKREEDKKISK